MNKNSDSYPDLKKNAQTGEKPASGANFLEPEPDLPEDYLLSSYNFDLPEAQIAQHPPERRGQSRLYLLDRNRPKGPEGPKDPGGPEGSGGADEAEAADLAGRDLIRDFSALPALLPPHSLLVANNSMVAPARLEGQRPAGGRFEFLLLTPVPLLAAAGQPAPAPTVPATPPPYGNEPWFRAEALALLRPQKKMRPGLYYPLGDGLGFNVESLEEFGQCRISLFWQGDLGPRIRDRGSLPLPPYIKRPDRSASPQDAERYQTVYADSAQAGSVAAPTAGLHFTPELRQALLDHGHDWADISLFVGYGTFSPVRVRDIRQHAMHPEYVEVSQSTVEKILQAKARGRPVIAVGTTSTRTLEGLAEMLQDQGKLLAPYRGWLNCFIYPGQPIRVIDGLLTNFHLPESTLLMLVSTLTGRKRLLAAYKRAVQSGLRFFSYGDAMLIR